MPGICREGSTLVVAGCSEGQSVRVWDMVKGEERLAFRAGQLVSSIALSPDGRTLVCGGVDETGLRLWELATGREVYALDVNTRETTAVAFSPDGRIIASSGIGSRQAGRGEQSAVIRLRDVDTGKEMGRFEGYASRVTSLDFSPDGSRLASGLENSTLLIWDTTSVPRIPGPKRSHYGPKELEELSSDLASEDATQAYRAIQILAQTPSQAVPFLNDRIHPIAEADPDRVRQLIADLDNNRFAVRAAAAKALTELGDGAQAALRKTLDGNPSVEVRKRVEVLLAAARTVPPRETLRTLRAIQVLERIGSSDARSVLEKLAKGAAAARETREAKDSLERLSRSRSRRPSSVKHDVR